ncbi:ABC transporter ATP-binding protein [Tersicoccus sp. MR15.9]|uniref:ABC transporter ATP-binding protein n=1 Tax=Tersicoccus mangrovi TaxID=3121635 RepID=UPI002FE5EF3B
MNGRHSATAAPPADRGTPNAVEAVGLTKRFGRHEALREVDFAVPAGSVYGLIGPNGAGKTTTMRILLDIIRPTSGRTSVAGEDSRTGGPDLRRRIGYLPGELTLQGRISGRRLLAHYAAVSGTVPRGRIEELAERLRLDLDRPVRKLSKGNKQKLGLIQAFMHDPEVLILDEPTSGLDPLIQREFLAMVRQVRDEGRTVLLSSHVISEIQEAADAVVILRDGTVVEVAGVEALRRSAVRRVRLQVQAVDGVVLEAGLADAGLTAVVLHPHDGVVDVDAEAGGPVRPLLRALANLPVDDLVLEEPDLQDAVLRLYGPQDDAGTGTADKRPDERPDGSVAAPSAAATTGASASDARIAPDRDRQEAGR